MPRRGGSQIRPSSVDRDARRARRLIGFRPFGRVSFPAMGKKPKDRREWAPMGVPAHSRATPGPHLRRIPLYVSAKVPARKIRFRISFLPGHWALVQYKIPACVILQPRLVPTSCGRWHRSGGAPDGTVPKTENGRASVPPLRRVRQIAGTAGGASPSPTG